MRLNEAIDLVIQLATDNMADGSEMPDEYGKQSEALALLEELQVMLIETSGNVSVVPATGKPADAYTLFFPDGTEMHG